MSEDIKLSRAQISKIIKPGVSFVSWLGNLGKKALTNVAIPFARANLPGLVSSITSNQINKFEIKISGKRAVRVGKGFTLFISNKDMNDIIKIMESLEGSDVLIDAVTETVKHEIKKTRRLISWYFVSTFGCFISTTSDLFSGKWYMWQRK